MRILVAGNVNADRVIRLRAPLARGADIGGEDAGIRLGGAAANTASALCHAGHAVRLVGCVGDDLAGDAIIAECARWPWDASLVGRQAGPTPQCLILVEPDGERTIVSLRGHLDPPSWPSLDLEGIDAVYVGSRTLPPMALFEAAHARAVPLVWQFRSEQRPSAAPEVVLAAEAALGGADPWASLEAMGIVCRWLVVTRGARGAMATDGRRRLDVPARPAAVVDTTGAGDAFAAGIVHGLAKGWEMAACLETATLWGSLAVAHEGSTAPATIAAAEAGGTG